ncbi:MAG: Oxidoreductase, short chain dehydrogenase/reductase family protein [Marmoricola sp.]|nr:Oxidoreductase, short chain dehydrogenase/reductase family protein [Marmoricola sp.]
MRTVLVTGAGRGIGRATTIRLAAAGWHVLAGVRRTEDGERLAAEVTGTVEPVQLDITSADDIAALGGRLTSLDAVVNNAGIVVGGPIEGLPLDDLRRQLEVNVVGQVAVTQAVLPLLRTSKGRVVFVSSLSGRIVTPMTGAYNASKFALEAVADALRMEVQPWRIKVSLVEPAQTDTDMWQTAEDELDATVESLTPDHRTLYDAHIAGMRKMIPMSQRMASPADKVAAAIERALTAGRPRARYVVGAGPKVQNAMARVTPTPMLDGMLRRVSGVPRSL